MKRGWMTPVLLVIGLQAGCAAMTARIDVYDGIRCGLEAEDTAKARLEAAESQHVAFVYDDEVEELKKDRDEAFEEGKKNPRQAIARLLETNEGQEKYELTALLDDPLVAQVVHADRKCWRPASPANRARAVSRGGNADIAIKMEKDGKFVVKGVRLDAEKVTEAVFKSATKAILLVAKASGVPVDSTPSDGETDDETSEPAHDVEISRIDSELRVERQAAADLLEELLANAAATEDDSARAGALERMETALRASPLGSKRSTGDAP